MILNAVGLTLALALAAWILSFVIEALRTEKIHHTNSTFTYSWRKEPVKFVLVVILSVMFGGMFLFAAGERAIGLLESLH